MITTYTLASGLIVAGMEWWQGQLTVALGNLIVLTPILLNSHPGTKYTNGFNVRALISVAVGVIPVLPGFINAALSPTAVPRAGAAARVPRS